MKEYILFTDEELDDLVHGGEVKVRMRNGEVLYFMAKEHFDQLVRINAIDEGPLN